MPESVLVALITGGLTAVASVIATLFSNNKTAALMEYRIKKLEEKQSIHNGVVERVYALEKRADLAEERQKVANHRIDDLENAPSFKVEQMKVNEYDSANH